MSTDISKGQKLGYIRVSTFDQNPERQLESLDIDKKFVDKASGRSIDRPKLKELIAYARQGDTIIAYSMDRLARDLKDLRNLVEHFTSKDIKVQFIKENLTFSGDDSAMSNLLLSIMGGFAEFERNLIKERQLEGIALAKKKGLYKGGKRKLSDEQVLDLQRRSQDGEHKAKLAREFGIRRETVYQYLRLEVSAT
ncbi:recombinase family protein [Candidatus Neptunichlamydia sp. REUL1]|uniref:recombinase family protein n=1 Tax=Candidatus Neptunichlamydia sp. REUL1 TaxID=3064277 RepID=UPI00292EA821|nr:recombinase family protein [Candidatus Neptunochlamydia sp. REUL1]